MARNLRVAFTGSSATGKTTLAAFVAELLGVPLNPVGSRSVAASMGLSSPYEADRLGLRAEFQRRMLAEKVAWEAEHESFVTDRTTVDQLAYFTLHDPTAIDDAYLRDTRGGMGRYTHVFQCPVHAFCEPGGDPARRQEFVYHRVYEATLNGLHQMLGGWGPKGIVQLDGRDLLWRKLTIASALLPRVYRTGPLAPPAPFPRPGVTWVGETLPDPNEFAAATAAERAASGGVPLGPAGDDIYAISGEGRGGVGP